MAERRLKVVLEAQVDRYKSAMSAAASSTKELEKAAKDAGNTDAKRAKALRELSPILMAVGTATVAGLGLSVKAAMDWESAWTGVMKTVDGTPEQLAKVEDGLRGLARELPASHAEIAAVAEAAGQLGVATPDVVEFTRTMINLGESTNMSAEEAATTLARFANVMGTSTSEMNNLGAAIVGLGNNYATTESEIAAMGQRLSGAGRQINLSEGQVLGLAAAMSSVGIEAEAGGTAMSLTMKRVGKAVDEGGSTLETFAKVSGMSAEEFQQAWREDAGSALTSFVEGLGHAGEQGESVNAILTELGITGVREADAMLRLSAAGELMGEAMATGVDEFTKGSALIEEAQKRYETAESRIKIAWNTIKDAAIDAGSVILPAIAGLADGIATLVGWFADLPAPVQTGVVALVSVAGVATLAVGAFAKFAPAIKGAIGAAKDLRSSFQRAEGPMTRAQTNISKVGRAAQTAAIGVAALGIIGPTIGSMVNSGNVAAAEDMADALFRIGSGGHAAATGVGDLDAMFTGKGNWFDGLDVTGLERSLEIAGNPKLTDNIDQWTSKILTFGTRGSSNMEFVTKNFEQLDATLSQMATSGAADQAAEAYEQIAEKAEAAGVPVEKLAELFPQYSSALANSSIQAKAAADGTGELEPVLDDVAASAQDAADALDEYFDGLTQAGLVVLSERDAHRGLAAAIDDAAASFKENGNTLDINTEKGRANEAALDGIASATISLRDSMYESGQTAGAMAAEVDKGRTAFIEAAVAAGMEADEAARLADTAGLIPADVFTEYESNAMGESEKIQDLHHWIQSTPDKKITITDDSPVTRAALEELGYIVKTLPDGRIQVSETGTDSTGRKIDATAGKKRTAKIDAVAITNAAENALNAAARDRVSRVSQIVSRSVQTTYSEAKNYGQGRQASGGRVMRRYSDGGRLPATGLGTDKILGMDGYGNPTAWVDDREWVINRRSSDKYHRELAMINAGTFPKLPGLADGGQAASVPQARDMVSPVVQPDVVALVAQALSGWQPVVKIGNRELKGLMARADQLA